MLKMFLLNVFQLFDVIVFIIGGLWFQDGAFRIDRLESLLTEVSFISHTGPVVPAMFWFALIAYWSYQKIWKY